MAVREQGLTYRISKPKKIDKDHTRSDRGLIKMQPAHYDGVCWSKRLYFPSDPCFGKYALPLDHPVVKELFKVTAFATESGKAEFFPVGRLKQG